MDLEEQADGGGGRSANGDGQLDAERVVADCVAINPDIPGPNPNNDPYAIRVQLVDVIVEPVTPEPEPEIEEIPEADESAMMALFPEPEPEPEEYLLFHHDGNELGEALALLEQHPLDSHPELAPQQVLLLHEESESGSDFGDMAEEDHEPPVLDPEEASPQMLFLHDDMGDGYGFGEELGMVEQQPPTPPMDFVANVPEEQDQQLQAQSRGPEEREPERRRLIPIGMHEDNVPLYLHEGPLQPGDILEIPEPTATESDAGEPEVAADPAAQNVDEEDDSSSSDFNNQANPQPPGRYLLPRHDVDAAVRELMAQSRRTEGGVASMLDREVFLQRIRRMIFSLERDRRRNRLFGNRENNSMEVDGSGNGGEEEQEPEVTNDVEPEPEPENPVRFDTSLPAEHSYLGTNMDRVSGVNYLDVGQRYKVLLFMHQHILFPGEVLPFMISGSIFEGDTNNDMQNGIIFGVCFSNLHKPHNEDKIYGITCAVTDTGTDYARGVTTIKSRALQRFVTKRSEFSGPPEFIAGYPQVKNYGYIVILPEIFLPEPLTCINMGSMNRFRDMTSMQDSFKRFQAASTPWPVHVYNNYNISSIVDKARTQLAQHKIDTMPTDPVHLSFWLVRNLHLSEAMMKTIFMTDSVNTRMRLISSTFKEDAVYICRNCGNRIANCRELFAMSKHGVQTQYCNSAGYVHETNTVFHLMRGAVNYSGEPSSEFSWFPGYQWQIIVCKICSRHIGWEFKALEPNLVPKSFFGISSSSVRIKSAANVPPDPRAVIYRNIVQMARREMQ